MKDLKYYIQKALKEHFALGGMNFSNLESLQGIAQACKELKSPALLSVSEGALNYMEEKYVMALANVARETPYLFLHLDHGKSYEICKKAVDLGFDSVMIDGSSLSFEDNIKLTKKVCKYAHAKNVLVEGELGQIKGIEDTVSSSEHHFTDPARAKEFVAKTGVDTLAIAIGTSHGAYKYKGKQELRFDILKEIEKNLPNFPLVLHGASTVNQELVSTINKHGGKLKNAVGIPENLLQEAVKKHNIIKINTDTDFRMAMTARTRETLENSPEVFDPRTYLGAGREEIKKVTEYKIKNIFFSENKK